MTYYDKIYNDKTISRAGKWMLTEGIDWFKAWPLCPLTYVYLAWGIIFLTISEFVDKYGLFDEEYWTDDYTCYYRTGKYCKHEHETIETDR